ncbi:MAG: HlyC/CorC family transporter [Planctomycetota bacterium]|nr:MAG: HlyC/CorC family transporter [Planctomycetota bacterium]
MLWLALLILLIGSALISASETALFGVSRATLAEFSRSRHPLRVRAAALMDQPRQVLMTLLMANTAVNLAIFTLSFFLFRSLPELPPPGGAIASLLAPVAVIVFGEMLPKATALTRAEEAAPWAAALVTVLHTMLAPLRWVLSVFLVEPTLRLVAPVEPSSDGVSTEELRMLVEKSAQEGEITSTENEMLQAVVALAEVSVREIMTPRVDIRFIPLHVDRRALLERVRGERRRRLPVVGRDLDDVRGFLYTRDVFLYPDRPLVRLMRPPHFIPEQANVLQALRTFRDERTHIAIVVDEYGGTAGLVTMEDVLAHLVGELPDAEPARPALTQRLDENTYRLPGNLSARAWAEQFEVDTGEPHVDTVAGLVLSRLGRLPRAGDRIRIRNLTLTVERLNRHRIDTVLVRRDPEPSERSRRETGP